MRICGITIECVGFIPQSLVLRSIVLGGILIYRNCSINRYVYSEIEVFNKSIGKEGNLTKFWHYPFCTSEFQRGVVFSVSFALHGC